MSSLVIRHNLPKEVISHSKNHLESFMVPKYVEFRDSLPKSSAGKIAERDIV
jgi:acyl-coenzyme A synthetase/AMP-(fatty) acid ligase